MEMLQLGKLKAAASKEKKSLCEMRVSFVGVCAKKLKKTLLSSLRVSFVGPVAKKLKKLLRL